MAKRQTQSTHRFKEAAAQCPQAYQPVRSLSEYMEALDSTLTSPSGHRWFRGHSDYRWKLAPSALRYRKSTDIDKALGLLLEFRRYADFRITRPPPFDDQLRWMQIAQHHGLPTRLLDWTLNAAAALYFTCSDDQTDGAVFLMDPTDLNFNLLNGKRRLLDAEQDRSLIKPYLTLDAIARKNGKHRTIALGPVINSERIQLQRGAFTLHGNRNFVLTRGETPSLCFIPVLASDKPKLLSQLASIGVDEMSLYPESEHLCSHLKRAAGLPTSHDYE